MIGTLLKSLPWTFLLLLPLMEAGAVAYFLRGALSRPWLFAVSSSIAIYFVPGYVTYRGLSGVGITAAPPNEPTARGLVSIGAGTAYLGFTVAAIWGISFLFRRGA